MSDRNLIEAIQHLAGTKGKDSVYYTLCSVNSVDVSNRMCACTPQSGSGQATFGNALLMASVDDGILYIPTVGSTVIVTHSTYNQPYVSFFSSLDKILYIVGGSALEIIDGTIQLNDGSFGGLVKVEALTTKINNLENLLNDLIEKYNTHVHPATSGTTSPTTTQETQTLTPTQPSDIENTTVTHGV